MRVLLLDDQRSTREWLEIVVKKAFPGAEIHSFETIRSASPCLQRKPDLALIDVNLGDGSGIEFLKAARATSPETVCVIVTMFADDATIVSALAAGADGYILKEDPESTVVQQLVQIKFGLPAIAPSVARRIMVHFGRTGPANLSGVHLSPREEDVLRLISKGMKNAEAAQELGISEATVASYLKEVYRKLGIKNRAEASIVAASLGIWP